MGVGALSLLFSWGFAEAIFFFVVADLGVSWIALRHGLKAGIAAALAASCGAILGIGLLYGWAERDAAAALAFVDAVPWVTPVLIADMRADLAEKGALAVLEAGATGMPIKLAAALAPEQGLAAGVFLAAGFVQRLARFSIVALLAFLPRRCAANGPSRC